MSQSGINARFFDSTRGRIVALLRRSSRTIDELALECDITDNAVRLHIGGLERDGVVRTQGVRREGTVGKPAVIYEINPAAEPVFSHAYVPFLDTLLSALTERMSTRELRALMRDVGHRLAGSTHVPGLSVEARADIAVDALTKLGALAITEPAEDDGALTVRGCSCPLAVAVRGRPDVCVAVQAMLSDITGGEVREKCDRSTDRPACGFRISA